MSKQDNLILMITKTKAQKMINELNEESKALQEDLRQTRNDLIKIQEEMETEFFHILGNIKLLNSKGKQKELTKYINEQYEIIKKDLFDDDQSNEQTIIIKVFK